MGDFNGKVGENREEDTIGPFGVGVRNDNGERVVNFCKRHNLFATNTWFQQRKSAQHTWISPDKVTKKLDRLYSGRQKGSEMIYRTANQGQKRIVIRIVTLWW